jgi:hypothetical protein
MLRTKDIFFMIGKTAMLPVLFSMHANVHVTNACERRPILACIPLSLLPLALDYYLRNDNALSRVATERGVSLPVALPLLSS